MKLFVLTICAFSAVGLLDVPTSAQGDSAPECVFYRSAAGEVIAVGELEPFSDPWSRPVYYGKNGCLNRLLFRGQIGNASEATEDYFDPTTGLDLRWHRTSAAIVMDGEEFIRAAEGSLAVTLHDYPVVRRTLFIAKIDKSYLVLQDELYRTGKDALRLYFGPAHALVSLPVEGYTRNDVGGWSVQTQSGLLECIDPDSLTVRWQGRSVEYLDTMRLRVVETSIGARLMLSKHMEDNWFDNSDPFEPQYPR